jgi:AraC-like DNA-binding protein
VRAAIFLPGLQLAHVMAALQRQDEVCIADSWDRLETLIRIEPLSVVVFNPAADGTLDVSRACRLIRKYGSIPFVAYVPLDAPFVRCIAHMANEGLQDLVVYRSNDSPLRFRETLLRATSIEELGTLVASLESGLSRLPHPLAQVLLDTLRQPHKYASAQDIAFAAGMTVSGLYRSFRVAGLSSPKSFLVGARVFRGYLYLRDTGFSVRDVASKLGYTHPRIFSHQIESVLGGPPSKVRRAIKSAEVAGLLLSWFGVTESARNGHLNRRAASQEILRAKAGNPAAEVCA